MEFRKSLLKAASVLALTAAAGQNSADAAISPVDPAAATKPTVASVTHADPLFALMERTNGSLAAGPVENALRDMYSDPSPAQTEGIPNLLMSLAGLGASSDVLSKSRDVLIELISENSKLDESLRDSVLTDLEESVSGFKLAQAQRRLRPCTREELQDSRRRGRICDPDEVGQTRQRDQGETGQVGPSGAPPAAS